MVKYATLVSHVIWLQKLDSIYASVRYPTYLLKIAMQTFPRQAEKLAVIKRLYMGINVPRNSVLHSTSPSQICEKRTGDRGEGGLKMGVLITCD
jgi:hypothetical protein